MEKQRGFFAGRTKTALRTEIRAEIGRYGYEEPFEYPLLAVLMEQKHYGVRKAGIVPRCFRKLHRPRGGYCFQAYFEELGWKNISWRVCIDGFSFKAELTEALRRAIQPFMRRHRQEHPQCERCGAPATEVDHTHPEFAVLAARAIACLSAEEYAALEASFDWLKEEVFELPEDCAARRCIVEAHKTAALMSVCPDCHLANSKERKAA
jgi:5-methylcytosine-specific restriction endonuclease McrA